MSAWWTFTILFDREVLTPEVVGQVTRTVEDLGYRGGAVGGAVSGMTRDGIEPLLFDSSAEAAEWIAFREGIFSLRNVNLGFEIDLSIQRAESALERAFQTRPDQPKFDELALTTSESSFRGPGGSSAWQALRTAFVSVLQCTPFTFAYALNEDALELTLEVACIHRRVSVGRLPPFLPWLTAVPAASPLANHVQRAADVARRPLEKDGLCLLTLTDTPWEAPTAAVLELSERWRASTGDAGCP
jgi:hypothetical protein